MVRINIEMSRSPKGLVAPTVVAPRRGLCLDFANTLYWRGTEHAEGLRNFGELVGWCRVNGILDDDASSAAARWMEKYPQQTAAIYGDAIVMRAPMYRALYAIAESKTPESRDIAAINHALDLAPVRRAIVHREKGFGWRVERDGFSAASLLAPVLWSAGDLMVSSEAARLRHCANETCMWLFLDDSKNGSRRWCSMQACGNRAKAHRHYLKTRSG